MTIWQISWRKLDCQYLYIQSVGKTILDHPVDSVRVYCHNFDVYVGKSDTVVNATFGLASKVVIDLTRPLLNKDYVV